MNNWELVTEVGVPDDSNDELSHDNNVLSAASIASSISEGLDNNIDRYAITRGKPRQTPYKKCHRRGNQECKKCLWMPEVLYWEIFFSSSSIKKIRTTLWTKSTDESLFWIHEKIDDSTKDRKKVLFQLKGEPVYWKAWLKAYGFEIQQPKTGLNSTGRRRDRKLLKF
ncbi:hypothetical protein ScPMuIL_001156 [Solemya velum]